MSAPRTPAEMADWLEAFAHEHGPNWGSDELEGLLFEAADMLRAVPTDAQKIEALKEASSCGENYACIEWCPGSDERGHYARYATRHARKAMRLLGLPTE